MCIYPREAVCCVHTRPTVLRYVHTAVSGPYSSLQPIPMNIVRDCDGCSPKQWFEQEFRTFDACLAAITMVWHRTLDMYLAAVKSGGCALELIVEFERNMPNSRYVESRLQNSKQHRCVGLQLSRTDMRWTLFRI